MRILIYRLGSIGDFIVSLPCLHAVRRRFPEAQINLLTNQPVDARAAPAMSVLYGTGLIDGYVSYSIRTRNLRELNDTARTIRSINPDMLIYLASRRSGIDIYRDWAFFRCCGIRHAIGFPFGSDMRSGRHDPVTGLWESEAHRLARTLAEIGPVDADLAENWDLHLSPHEIARAQDVLARGFHGMPHDLRLFGLSVGTKQPVKDWGVDNWRTVLHGLARDDLGLVLIGSKEEWLLSEQVLKAWPGPILNLCGRTSPRLAAAIIKNLGLLLCHDSGPMHLASTVGTRCIAIFSRLNLPGQWFPFGSGHKVFYPPNKTDSIEAIRPSDVVAAVKAMLQDGERILAIS